MMGDKRYDYLRYSVVVMGDIVVSVCSWDGVLLLDGKE